MAEPSDYLCSSSSEDDEYSDPLEVAVSAGARLSTPEKASTSRKRKVQTNPAEKKSNVRGSVDPNVSAWDRVNEFKDQCLTTVSGNLRCDACRETLSKKLYRGCVIYCAVCDSSNYCSVCSVNCVRHLLVFIVFQPQY